MSYNSTLDVFAPGAPFFGDGSDGDAVIATGNTFSRDRHYNNLTVTSAGSLDLDGFRLFVKGVLTLNGVIHNNGLSVGVNVATGAAAAGSGTTGNSAAGGTSTIGNGGAGGSSTTSLGAAGGAGGANDTRTGGAGGTVTPLSNLYGGANIVHNISTSLFWCRQLVNSATLITGGAGGGAGAGTGANSGTGGGSGGGVVLVAARKICSNTGGSIEAKGGNGGNRNTFNASSGGGGGGGFIYILTAGLVPANITVTAAGGTGGTVTGAGFSTVGATGSTGTIVIDSTKELS